MRRLALLTTIITMLLSVNTSIVSAKESIDFKWYAQIWDYDAGEHFSDSMPAYFTAIEVKNQKEYIPALKEFLKMRSPLSPNHAEAAYVLAKLGEKEFAENYFNDMLAERIDYEKQSFPEMVEAKAKVLKYMHNLGFKFTNVAALRAVQGDIIKLTNKDMPALAIKIIAQMNMLKAEAFRNDDDKRRFVEVLSTNWIGVNPNDLRLSGIQPDWRKALLSNQGKKNKYQLINLFLAAADEKSRREFAVPFKEPDKVKNLETAAKPFIAASVGEEKAIKFLQESLDNNSLHYCNSAYPYLPDKVLIKAIDVDLQNDIPKLEFGVLRELKKRGYEKEVSNYMEKRGYTKWENPEKSKKVFKSYQQIEQILDLLDPVKTLDALWQYHEKYPNNVGIALLIIWTPMRRSDVNLNPDALAWLRKNYDKYAQAIKTVIKNYANPARIEKDRQANLGYHGSEYDYKDMAFQAMTLLPEETFNKYFSNIDPQIFTKSAFITGNYFQAEWAYKKDQKKFYERYGNKQ